MGDYSTWKLRVELQDKLNIPLVLFLNRIFYVLQREVERVCFDLAIFWLKVNVFGYNASFSSLSLHMIKTKSVNWLTLRSFYRVLFDLENLAFFLSLAPISDPQPFYISQHDGSAVFFIFDS